ncbi:MAG: homoaconitate hydratase [Candidatus Helarchaeota archaeon]|nr:homoaconitate hydratase [Candidatus Helarchaeota archaeon]
MSNTNYLKNQRELDRFQRTDLLFDYNALDTIRPPTLPSKIFIWDETLRDGEQTPGVSLNLNEKLDIAKLLDEIGVDIIAVGYPAVTEDEKIAVKTLARESFKHAQLAAPARTVKMDIDACLACDVPEIPIFYPVSDLAMELVMRKSYKEAFEDITNAIQYSNDHGIITDFVLMDATRTSLERLQQFCKVAIEAGADKIVIADTVGCMGPVAMKYFIRNLKEYLDALGGTPLSIHCHNDLGLAHANTLAAIEEGANYPHVCVNGYGERAGNTPLEELVTSLQFLYGIKTVNLEKLYELANLVEAYFGLPLSTHKAIVGVNSFSHESGLHVHAILSGGPIAIEPFPPKMVGRERKFYMGKFSGRSTIKYVLKIGQIQVTDQEIYEILQRIKDRPGILTKEESLKTMKAIKEKITQAYSGLNPIEFWKIVEDVTGKKPKDERLYGQIY